MEDDPTPGEIVILASGTMIFIFSFFTWLDFGPVDRTAWDDGSFPLHTLPVVLGLVMATQIALDRFGAPEFPNEVAGFTWPQLHLVLGAVAALNMIALFITTTLDGDPPDLAFGFWFSLLGSLGLFVGAVMLHRDTPTGGSRAGGQEPPGMP